MTPVNADAVLARARAWVGTPYHHRAQVMGGGVDCLLLIADVYTALGLIPVDIQIPDYPPDIMFHSDDSRYLDAVLAHCDEVDAPQRGGLALFRYGRSFSHGAIVADWPQVIHAYAPLGRVVEMSVRDDRRLMNRVVRYFAPRGLA